MDTRWGRHIQDKAKREEFEKYLLNTQTAFRRLKDLLEEFEKEVDNTEFSITDFDSPAWAAKQAFRNGQRSSIRKVKELLNFVK